jgi:hypothetical protein
MASHAEFKLSITQALAAQLAEAIDQLTPAPLGENELATLLSKPGVYQLYHHGELVYVGKADESLPSRLEQHHRKIAGRQSISVSDMSFTCLYVEEDLSAVAPETLLIKRYRAADGLPWDGSGFGRKDPGSERDTTKMAKFDAWYPIRLDWPCHGLAGDHKIVDLLKLVKEELPYLFRYQEATKAPTNQPVAYRESEAQVPAEATARDVFQAVVDGLPAGWQITALHGYVIMYQEDKTYPTAMETIRRD